MNVFLLHSKLPLEGDDLIKGVYGDIPSALLALTKLIEGLREHVVMFYSIREWTVGDSIPCRYYRISMIDGKLVALSG